MWINFYRNIMTGTRHWFERIYLEPIPKMVKVRINQTALHQQSGAQQRRLNNSRYKY